MLIKNAKCFLRLFIVIILFLKANRLYNFLHKPNTWLIKPIKMQAILKKLSKDVFIKKN